jgi:hypothetical protein
VIDEDQENAVEELPRPAVDVLDEYGGVVVARRRRWWRGR